MPEDIFPRDFQLLTAGNETPANAAAAEGPPTASMTESTVLSMESNSSQNVKMSTLHALAIDFPSVVLFDWTMAEPIKSLAGRLQITREALEISPAQLCKRIGIAENRWSQYENGKRRITTSVAIKLCDEFDLSLDWIYRANPAQLPHALRLKMRQAAA